jgi:hypothetical protein
MTPLDDALVIDGIVLIATLEADLGPRRKIGRIRILRPLVTMAAVIPLFLDRPASHGNGLLVELAGLAAGLLCGLAVSALIRVYRSPETGKPVSAAGLPYALAWTLIAAARGVFSYGASHWFPAQITQWSAAHQVTGAAITDGLIVMAVVTVLARTVTLATRSRRVPAAATAMTSESTSAAA